MKYELGEVAIKTLNEIAVFGADPTGGETRFIYTDAWLKAQNLVKDKLEQSGFSTNFDEVGNLFGKIKGTKYPDETILTGSHIDTVRNGGIYDGQYGITASFMAINYLKEKYGEPLRNLEVVSFSEEEGSRFNYAFWGSDNLCKLAKKEIVINLEDEEGINFTDAMTQSGFNYRDETVPFRKDITGFLEIHIEQGKVLETDNIEIGVVRAIAGQHRFNIVLTGESNHAGTTPMRFRKDTVLTMSQMVNYIIETAHKYGDPLVATIGKILVEPNTVNVVPGKTLFTLDTRHTDLTTLNKFTTEIFDHLEVIATINKTTVKIDQWMDASPVPMSTKMVDTLENACKKLNYSYKVMHSGAGHDAMVLAPFVPTAMLFVPSVNGISHSPAELTEIEFLEKGIMVMAEALYQLVYIE